MDLASKIRNIPDFPKPGIQFKDITTLIGDPEGLQESIRQIRNIFDKDDIDTVVGMESRGFIFGSILAYEWGKSFVPVRKPGKLPGGTISESYDLEYGQNSLEIHVDAIAANQKVLIIDDLLATGGTAEATIKLVERLGGKVVACCFVIELDYLNPRSKLKGYRVESLVHVVSE